MYLGHHKLPPDNHPTAVPQLELGHTTSHIVWESMAVLMTFGTDIF